MSALDVFRAARSALAFQQELAGDWLPNPLHVPSSSAPPDTPTIHDSRIEALIPAEHPVQRMTSLEELLEWVGATPLVPIDEQRTNPVLGVGNPTADLMIVGEAPGAEEDRRGEPFVGRAGQLLDKILAAIGFDRSDVYITNILKSRPPKNRDPRPEEVEAHIPILYKQIAFVQPRLILCVGKQAGCGLLGRSVSLKALRGQFHDFHGIPTLVTFHPAALLRNPQWKKPTWEDVQLLRSRYDELGCRPAAARLAGTASHV